MALEGRDRRGEGRVEQALVEDCETLLRQHVDPSACLLLSFLEFRDANLLRLLRGGRTQRSQDACLSSILHVL